MAWMFLTRVRSTRNTCARNVKSWATTAAVCNDHLSFRVREQLLCPKSYCSSSIKAVNFLPANPIQVSHVPALHTIWRPFLLSEASDIDGSSSPPFFPFLNHSWNVDFSHYAPFSVTVLKITSRNERNMLT